MPPRSCFEASRLIDELKRRAAGQPLRTAAARSAPCRTTWRARRGDAARVREELEVTGYGCSATWKRGRLMTATDPGARRRARRTSASSSAATPTSAGERVVYGQRVLGVVRLVDVPANGHGRRYVIERELTCMAELEAIVADYLAAGRDLGRDPCRRPVRPDLRARGELA